MDPKDAGITEQWYNQTLPDKINLPGILQAQGYGDVISISTPWVAALPRDMRWYLLPQYKAYTQPGNVKMPYLSQPPRHYLGVAWYQRDIDIPRNPRDSASCSHWNERDGSPRFGSTIARSALIGSFVAPHLFSILV